MSVTVTYKGLTLEFDQPPTAEEIRTRYEQLVSQPRSEREPSAAAARVTSAPPRDHYPLSYIQESFWLQLEFNPTSPGILIPYLLRMKGRLEVKTLHKALQAVVDRHPELRTIYGTENGVPHQRILEEIPLEMSQADFSGLSPEQRDEALSQLIHESGWRRFDLSCGPLLRAELAKFGEQDHVLLLTTNHIMTDGTTQERLFQEVGHFYGALTGAEVSELPPLPLRYTDYAVWEREQRAGSLEAQEAYWKEKLGGELEVLNFPTDRPRVAGQSHRGASLDFQLEEQMVNQLRTLGRGQNATTFMTLLASYYTLLHRYTGQEDMIVGIPISGRSHEDLKSMFGCFINMLALRTSLAGNPTFSELLQRTRTTALEAFARQDCPFKRVVEVVNPQREANRTPVYQVAMNYGTSPLFSIELPELKITTVKLPKPSVEFDLALDIMRLGSGLTCRWEYDADLFDASTITRIHGHFRTLLEAVVADPDRRISDLPLLSNEERRQILVEWNGAETAYPDQHCIHELFEAQAERTPEAVAVVFEDRQLTYRELNARSNQLAHYLRARGVDPEVLVGICVERSLEMIVGVLGILKAGGAYVPLDPSYPKERLAFMLEDAATPVLVTQQSLVGSLPKHAANLVCLDTEGEAIAKESEENPTSGVGPDNLVYVIYTSGSTGKPKGVLVQHRGLCSSAQVEIQTFDVRPDSRVLLFASLNFDASIMEIVMALPAGAALHLGREESLLPGAPLIRTLREQGITTTLLPPSTLEALSSDEPLPALQCLIVGGEACSANLVERWSEGRRFFNAYGPTENTIWATVDTFVDGDLRPTIGRPIGNVQVYLLDANLQPVPIGVPGEVYVGGVGVTRGYLNQPELTAEKFIPDPFSGNPGARLFVTADLARWLPDGRIEFLGRSDDQVKLRGFRIELGEIETVLASHQAVRLARVVLHGEDLLGKQLVAYFVADGSPSTLSLRRSLKDKLPDHMIPAQFVQLAAFPQTPSGKVDLKALPKPKQRAETSFVAPRTATERTIADVWQKALNAERIGIADSFVSLGGHSLIAIVVIDRLKKALGHQFHAQDLLSKTLGQLATICDEELKPR